MAKNGMIPGCASFRLNHLPHELFNPARALRSSLAMELYLCILMIRGALARPPDLIQDTQKDIGLKLP